MTDLSAMLAKLEQLEKGGASIIDLMVAAKLDPLQGFRGGNWTFVKFDGLNLDKANLSETRLFGATFRNTSVAGTDFRGAADATPIKGPAPGLYAARNWSDALLDDHQRFALLSRDYRKAPSQTSAPISQFISQGVIDVSNFHDFMRKSGDYEIAREIYERMKQQGLKPNKYALTALIDLSVDCDERIDRLYEEARIDKIEVDEFVLNAMADAYQDIAKAEAVRDLYSRHGLTMSEYYYNIMVNKPVTREGAEKYLGWMAAAQIPASNITFNSLMKKCNNWQDRKQLIDVMVGKGMTLRPYELNILLMAAATKQELRDTLEMFRVHEVAREMPTENIRIHKRDGFGDKLAVVREAIAFGLEPDEYTQKALILSAGDIAQICKVMALLRPFAGKIDIFNEQTIKRMVKVSPIPTWSFNLVRAMQMEDASTRAQARALVEHWIDESSRAEVLQAVFDLRE